MGRPAKGELSVLTPHEMQYRMLAKRIDQLTKIAAEFAKRALAAETELTKYEGKMK